MRKHKVAFLLLLHSATDQGGGPSKVSWDARIRSWSRRHTRLIVAVWAPNINILFFSFAHSSVKWNLLERKKLYDALVGWDWKLSARIWWLRWVIMRINPINAWFGKKFANATHFHWEFLVSLVIYAWLIQIICAKYSEIIFIDWVKFLLKISIQRVKKNLLYSIYYAWCLWFSGGH